MCVIGGRQLRREVYVNSLKSEVWWKAIKACERQLRREIYVNFLKSKVYNWWNWQLMHEEFFFFLRNYA